MSNERYSLGPDEREVLNAMLEGGLDTSDKRGYVLGLLSDLRALEAADNESARRIIDTMTANGLYRELTQHARKDSGIFKDPVSGQVLNVPKRGSISERADDGTKTGIRQLRTWVEMTRPELVEWLDQQRHQAESLRFKIRGFQTILAAWEQFPEAQTVGEVCERAGIDPESLELGWAA